MSVKIDMRRFARGVGPTMTWSAGSVIFAGGGPGPCMYIVQMGVIDMLTGDDAVETAGANKAIGFISMIDGAARSTTARVREPRELSAVDRR